MMVPASVVLKVKLGVVSLSGVGTGVMTARIGASVSIVKDGINKTADTFPAVSVTMIVQSVYVPGVNALKVTVLFPDVVEVEAAEQEPP